MHQARPWNGNEVEHKATAWRWQNGSEEVRHSPALHGDEGGEECMRHDVKRREKYRDSVAVISQSDKIKRKRETTKSVEMMLGVLSRNSQTELPSSQTQLGQKKAFGCQTRKHSLMRLC